MGCNAPNVPKVVAARISTRAHGLARIWGATILFCCQYVVTDAASGGRHVGCTVPLVQWRQPVSKLLPFWAPLAGNVIVWTQQRRAGFKAERCRARSQSRRGGESEAGDSCLLCAAPPMPPWYRWHGEELLTPLSFGFGWLAGTETKRAIPAAPDQPEAATRGLMRERFAPSTQSSSSVCRTMPSCSTSMWWTTSRCASPASATTKSRRSP